MTWRDVWKIGLIFGQTTENSNSGNVTGVGTGTSRMTVLLCEISAHS